MADLKFYDVILKPVITEESMRNMSQDVTRMVKDKDGKFVKEVHTTRKYTFLVHPDATKTQIKDAVQKMFEGVKVDKVNTMNYEGKTKVKGKIKGKTVAKKKAIITVTEDSKDIQFFAGM